MSQLSDSDYSIESINSDSQRSADSTNPKNNPNVKRPFPKSGKPILSKTGSKSLIKSVITSSVPIDYTINASRDAIYARTHANSDADYQAVDNRRNQNRASNTQARLKLVKKYEENRDKNRDISYPPNPSVTINVNQNSEHLVKRKSLKGTVTVEEDRRQKSMVVAYKVSDILFELLKRIPLDQVKTRLDELIANASPVNTSLKRSDRLTVRQLNHLNSTGLFDKAIEMTLDKLNNYKHSDTTVAYTESIINSVKDKLLKWLFGTTTRGGYSRSKTIKRSSKKLTKRIRSKKRRSSLKRSKKRRSSKDFV